MAIGIHTLMGVIGMVVMGGIDNGMGDGIIGENKGKICIKLYC